MIPDKKPLIGLGAVNITPKTKELMLEALETGEIGSGKYVEQFENEFANWFGVKHAIATSNGTMADACALAAVKYLDGGKRTEVIVPALTFVAQINAVWYNHLTPVFVDVNYDFNIAVEKIEEKITDKTLAIMPVHLLGRPAAMHGIRELADKYGLFVVEDACEALGSKYFGQKVGSIGDVGCFSFFVSHSITTGEGGIIVTNDDQIAALARSLRNHGRKSNAFHDKFLFPMIGFSAKMNSLEAIIGLGIIPQLNELMEKRRQNALLLNALLGDRATMVEGPGEYIVPHSYPILVDSYGQRQKLLIDLPQRHSIEVRQIFYSLPTQSEAYAFLKEKLGSYPVSEDIGNRGLYVPCHQNVGSEEIMYTAGVLKEIF